MSAHSPEPWTYDDHSGRVYDASGEMIAKVVFHLDPPPHEHANGHRIAALSQENAALRSDLEKIRSWDVVKLRKVVLDLVNNTEGKISDAHAQLVIQTLLPSARTALRAGGAEKGVGT